MSFFVLPSHRQTRSLFQEGERGGLNCKSSAIDGRRSLLTAAYRQHIDLDLGSSDTLIYCQTSVLPPGFRDTQIDPLMASVEETSLELIHKLNVPSSKALVWQIHVLLDRSELNDKIRFAFRTHLASAGFQIRGVEGYYPQLETLRDRGIEASCELLAPGKQDGHILLLRPSQMSLVFRPGICTQEGGRWF